MKKVIISLTIMLCHLTIYSQNNSDASELEMTKMINTLSEYYNNQKFTNLSEILSDSLQVFEFPDKLRSSNLDQVISQWKKTFIKYPKNKAEIFDIYIVGNKAILKERIYGRGEPFETVLIYEFSNGEIIKVWFISNSPTTVRAKKE